MKHFLTTLSVFFFISAYAQKENNIWYFGVNAGLDFNQSPPTALLGMINTIEGVASVSDTSGQLLFYTDGITVYNRQHAVMLNGSGLGGGHSASQSAVIVPKPQTPGIYYIFTVPQFYGPGGFQYSEVDMNLDNGKGGITGIKNVELLPAPIGEKIVTVRHANGVDVWVITADMQTEVFYSFLVSQSGVDGNPVNSFCGTSFFYTQYYLGCMSASADGKYVTLARDSRYDKNDLMQFDAATGELSDWIHLSQVSYGRTYSMEFSPDGSKLYTNVFFTDISSGPNIYQYDLSDPDPAAIQSSRTLIGTLSNSPGTDPSVHPSHGTMQVGPDNRLYIAKHLSSMLALIEHPDSLGAACGFVNDGVQLQPGTLSDLGLPAPVQSNYLTSAVGIQQGRSGNSPFVFPGILVPGEAGRDVFVIKGLSGGTAKLKILDTSGNFIYQAEAYTNNWKPTELPGGVYYYLLETKTGENFRGHFLLVQ